MEKILKVPHLCEIGVNSIFRANDREAACNFIGNISYDSMSPSSPLFYFLLLCLSSLVLNVFKIFYF